METPRLFFNELDGVEAANPLYARWIDYAKTLSRDEALQMVRFGLTHQARALRSMIREATASIKVAGSLYVKLEALVQGTLATSAKLR